MGELGKGDEVVIIGAGGVGMMAIQIALSKGIDPIVADIDEAKLAAARELGVTRTFDSSDPQSGKEIRKSTGGALQCLTSWALKPRLTMVLDVFAKAA